MIEALPALRVDLAGMTVRRLLPRGRRRLVGPWCFLDLYGPVEVAATRMDVPPHPHIGIQTVSWLFEGEVVHKDSLGRKGVGRPGVLNLMTAGAGIAHSEESPPRAEGRLHGVQLWIALPEADRATEPRFRQHGALPRLPLEGGGEATVFAGTLAGAASPARTFSPLVGADLRGAPGSPLRVPLDPAFEHAVALVEGTAAVGDTVLAPDVLYVLDPGRDLLTLDCGPRAPRVLLLGGAPFPERILMWWNFVARTTDEIVAAREDWRAGRRFGAVAAYKGARLEAPPFAARPVPPNPAS